MPKKNIFLRQREIYLSWEFPLEAFSFKNFLKIYLSLEKNINSETRIA